MCLSAGLFRLGPTFVKFGQVISTRTDVVEKEYIEVLKDLQVCCDRLADGRSIC